MNLPQLKTEDIVLGDLYQDVITEFKGRAIGKTTWITGCDTIGLVAPFDKDGKMMDAQWFDVARLKSIEPVSIKEKKLSKDKGGPQPIPRKSNQ